jgi:hypothetical protein
MRSATDLLILLVLTKEFQLLAAQQAIPLQLYAGGLMGLSFALGVAPSPGLSSAAASPVATTIRTGLTIVALILYLNAQVMAGTLPLYAGVLAVVLSIYALGRFLGWTLRAVWFALGLLLVGALLYSAMGQVP